MAIKQPNLFGFVVEELFNNNSLKTYLLGMNSVILIQNQWNYEVFLNYMFKKRRIK